MDIVGEGSVCMETMGLSRHSLSSCPQGDIRNEKKEYRSCLGPSMGEDYLVRGKQRREISASTFLPQFLVAQVYG
jgi:hypothetical protein